MASRSGKNASVNSQEAAVPELLNKDEKKRIQNRIAQRIHRQRMKLRIEELTAKVKLHEQQQAVHACTMENGNDNCKTAETSPGSPKARARSSISDSQTDSNGYHFRCNDGTSKQPSGVLVQPPTRDMSQDPSETIRLMSTALTSPVTYDGHYFESHTATRPWTNCNLLDNASCNGFVPYDVLMTDDLPFFAPDVLVQDSCMTGPSSQTPSPPEKGMSVAITEAMGMVISPLSTDQDNIRNIPDSCLNPQMPQGLLKSPSGPEAERSPLAFQIDQLVNAAASVGFKDFDDMVIAFYTTRFSRSPFLSNLQKISRNRRLPRLIASLQESAMSWSKWERRGFNEELIRNAETVFMRECHLLRQSKSLQNWPEEAERARSSSANADVMAERRLQDEVSVTRSYENSVAESW